MKIEKDTSVKFNYVIKNSNGEVLASSTDDGEDSASYIHGYTLILPKLEEALEGHKEGDTFDVLIKKEDAFGDRSDELIFEVEKDVFHSDTPLEVGMEFSDEHSGHTVRIAELRNDKVLVDANHPFAGLDLTFSVTVGELRKASEEEIEELMRMLSTHSHSCGCGCHDSGVSDSCACGDGCGDCGACC